MARNSYYEDLLISCIKMECRKARREDGVAPSHVGMHPEDVRRIREWYDKHYRGVLVYYAGGSVHEVEIYSDESLEEGTANIVNKEAAFVAGYIDDPGW